MAGHNLLADKVALVTGAASGKSSSLRNVPLRGRQTSFEADVESQP